MRVDLTPHYIATRGAMEGFTAFHSHLAEAAEQKGSAITFDEMHALLGPFLGTAMREGHQKGWYEGVALAYLDQKQRLTQRALPPPLHRHGRQKGVAHVC